jgi:protein subunit release factor A
LYNPFESNARRHIILGYFYLPHKENINRDINPADFELPPIVDVPVDNSQKTDSAIRITHFKTGIVVHVKTSVAKFKTENEPCKYLNQSYIKWKWKSKTNA